MEAFPHQLEFKSAGEPGQPTGGHALTESGGHWVRKSISTDGVTPGTQYVWHCVWQAVQESPFLYVGHVPGSSCHPCFKLCHSFSALSSLLLCHSAKSLLLCFMFISWSKKLVQNVKQVSCGTFDMFVEFSENFPSSLKQTNITRVANCLSDLCEPPLLQTLL